jgi:hypothetical protein
MKLSARKWISRVISSMSWGLGFVLVLSAFSAPVFAQPRPTPEMDPSQAVGAVALVSSGLLLISGWRRRSK